MNNYSISQSRIVNLQRSTTAIVFFDMKLSLKILEGDKLDRFREALEIYVQNRPRIWDSMACCRHDLFGTFLFAAFGLFCSIHSLFSYFCCLQMPTWNSSFSVLSFVIDNPGSTLLA